MNVVILKWNFFFEDTICFSRDFYWVFFFLLIQKVVSHSFDLKKKMFHSMYKPIIVFILKLSIKFSSNFRNLSEIWFWFLLVNITLIYKV